MLKTIDPKKLWIPEKHCATRVLLVTHFYRKPPLEEGYAGEIAVTGGLIDRFRLADQ